MNFPLIVDNTPRETWETPSCRRGLSARAGENPKGVNPCVR